MGTKKKEGVLTAIKVRILFRIQEYWDEHKVPPRLVDIAKINDKVYVGPTILYHLNDLIAWGYVDVSVAGQKRWAWRLTELGQSLVSNDPHTVVGRGSIR